MSSPPAVAAIKQPTEVDLRKKDSTSSSTIVTTRESSSDGSGGEDDACNFLNCGCLETFSNVVTGFIEGIFYKIGLFTGSYPWAGILIGLAIFFIPLAGIARYNEETDGSKLWVPQDSRAVADYRRSTDWFPGYQRIAQVIVVATDVLDSAILTEALTLDEKIKAITVQSGNQNLTWDDTCKKTGPYCLHNSVLEVWSYDRTTIQALTKTTIETDIDTITTSPVTNSEIDASLWLGGTDDADGDAKIDSARAMSLTYFIKTFRSGDDPEDYILEWEQKFLDICEEGIGGGASVYYFAARSVGDIGGSAIDGDLQFLAGGYFLVIIYLIMALGKFNRRDQKIYMAICGIVCIGMSMGISYGLSSAFGLFYSPLHNILPFLLLGIGVDDMFVFVAAWDNLGAHEKTLPLREKIGHMTKHAGVSILITSLTDFAAFTIGAITIIPALRSFCIFAALGILGIFSVTLFLFAGCFAYDQKRTAASRDACLCCLRLPVDYKPNQCSENPLSVRVFDKVIARGLSYLPVKIVVVGVAVVLLGFGVWGVVEIEQDYQQEWFIPKGNYFYDYLQIANEYFPDDGWDGYVYMGSIDYYSRKDALLSMESDLGGVRGVTGASLDFWLEAFYDWTAATTNSTYTPYITAGEPSSSANFDHLVHQFITEVGEGSAYRSDVQFNEADNRVLRSRMSVKFAKTETSSEGIGAMDRARAAVDDGSLWSAEDVFVFTDAMLTWEGDKVIRLELFRNVGLAFVVVFLVCMVLIANIVTVLLVLACVMFTLVDVIGFLHFWGNTINVVTTIMVILAVGLAVDYAAHIGHTFMVSTGTKQQRMRVTLRDIGTAVFNGGFSTFLAFFPLAFATSFVFQKFFQIFFLVSLFGLFHGLIFLPVMLSLVGPSPYLSAQQRQQQQQQQQQHQKESINPTSSSNEMHKAEDKATEGGVNNFGFVTKE
ncbi:NPC intracellular cholesterol transporter 1-like [Symsagittifera roscoffensis]|uniref:NPC intracellular cholesterol transporter 1-like n=1 Tax=Symsagittifera roscoffensis TaxID=84072 RepID=UPI00307C0070